MSSSAYPNQKNNIAAAYGLLALSIVIWGAAPAFVRSFSLLTGPSDALFIRSFAVAFCCLCLLPFLKGPRIVLEDWPRLVAASWFGILVYFVGTIFGYIHVSTGVGGVISAINPLFVVLLAAALGKDRLTLPTIMGLGLSFAGSLLLFRGGGTNSQSTGELVLGGSLILLSGIGWAIYVVFTKPLIMKYGAMKITVWTMLLCTIPAIGFYTPTTIPTALSLDWRALLALLYLTLIGTVIIGATWNYAVAHLPTSIIGGSLYLIPLIAIFAGALILSEPIEPTTLVSGAVIVAGVALAQFGDRLSLGNQWAALLAVIMSVTAWGMVPVITRYLVLNMPAETVMFLRVVPAGVIGLCMVVATGLQPMTWNAWRRVLLAAIAGNVMYQVLAVYGARDLPASWIGMLFGLEPVFIAIFAVLFAKERLTPWLGVGIAVALIGTGVLMAGNAVAPAADVKLIGLILVTLSTMGWGIYTIAIKPVSAKYGTLPVTGLTLGVSAFPMLFFISPQLITSVQTVTPFQWLIISTLVIICTILATMAWNFAVGRLSGSIAGVFLYIQPLVGLVTGVLLLGEQVTMPLIIGGALIIFGVVIAQFGPTLARSFMQKADLNG